MRWPHAEALTFVQRIDQNQRANPGGLRRALERADELAGRTIACIEQRGRLRPRRSVARERLPQQQHGRAARGKPAVAISHSRWVLPVPAWPRTTITFAPPQRCASTSSSRTLRSFAAKVSNWYRYCEITRCSA